MNALPEARATVLEAIRARAELGGLAAPILADESGAWAATELLDAGVSLAERFRAEGVHPRSRIAIDVRPSAAFVVSVVATWLAGCSYVPVSSIDRPDLLPSILCTSRASLLVTCAQAEHTKIAAALDSITLTRTGGADAGELVDAALDEAYVIYTSGSTGDPRGVSVGHAALGVYLEEAARIYELHQASYAFPLQLPVTFDASITSYLLPMVSGGTCLPLAGTPATRSTVRFLESVDTQVLLKTTPSQLRLFRQLLSPKSVSRLRGAVVVGGEALYYEDLNWLRATSDLRIYNEYGPTEATVGCIVHRVEESDPVSGPVPVGCPHRGVTVSLDRQVPDAPSDTGLLILSGPCLANGYIGGQPGGFGMSEGVRTYNTGDLFRERDGLMYFVGRVDEQIKLNGHRVEVSEVESILQAKLPSVKTATVFADGLLTVVVEDPAEEVGKWRSAISRSLPNFMRLAPVVVVRRMPVSAHGKIDKSALREVIRSGAPRSGSGGTPA